ncbi:hypothetical protein C8Q75DRAFT_798252 [Abortiporus biennis]|nr:hypothetical protein C8Q75DRAFT_798252 [Abortiporus biennis]
MPAKKPRPPNLSLETTKRPSTTTIIEFQTPIDILPENGQFINDVSSQKSSPSSSDSEDSPIGYSLNADTDSDMNGDEISRDLAVLEQLRRSVRKNLKLRPIRSASSSVRVQDPSSSQSSDSPRTSLSSSQDRYSPSPDSAISPDSAYFTPLSEFRATPISALHHSRQVSIDTAPRSSQPPSQPSSSSWCVGVSPALLLSRLSSPTRPLLIDTRPTNAFLASRLQRSVNMAIPSLILKRSRKPAGAFHSLDALRQYITTEEGLQTWDDLIANNDWDGDVIVYDENMDERDRNNTGATAWSIMDMIGPLLQHGSVDYLEGGLASARRHPYLSQLIVTQSGPYSGGSTSSQLLKVEPSGLPSSAPNSGKRVPSGMFQLDIQKATRAKPLPEVEQLLPTPSPQPVMPSAMPASQAWTAVNDYSTPSPPPSSTVFSRPQPPRRPSIPTLRRIDTASTERLPKLQVRTGTTKAATLAPPPITTNGGTSSLRSRSRSPSHLNLVFSNHSPPSSARLLSPNPNATSFDLLPPPSPSYSQPSTPRTPMPPSPQTARPDGGDSSSQPPTTGGSEDPLPEFTVSTILPSFLFLGPELTTEEHVQELLSLGVKRILNIAIECDDDHGLRLRERFERYHRIPMRDTVEEDNITKGVREACTLLDDARLHSAPTYVHCKAGKSRSVTAVMAYLIHANHWTLSRAYAFVVGRRKGISPNIGFVSELMTFEEQELGGKSVGVVKMPTPSSADPDSAESTVKPPEGANGSGFGGNYSVAVGGGPSGRRPQHLRESLPPAFSHQHSFNLVMPRVGDVAQLGDSQQELEIKDAEGRYRHARRAPVDEATLQPMRRVSKAGLESSAYV